MSKPSGLKRIALPLNVKMQILHEVDKNRSKTEIAKQFKISPSTLSTILKNKEKILKSQKEGFAPESKRTREAKFPALEKALIEWIKKCRSKNIPVNGALLKAKAETFALQMDFGENFNMSDGWLQRFKKRHGLAYKKICGESASVNKESAEQWKKSNLQDLLKEYAPEDVYNADETGLMYQLLPDRTFALKNDNCSGTKKAKIRISILVAANMTGTDKLPLLIIGKAKNPRCFKGLKRSYPTDYKANKKSWMTADIFKEWLLSLDRKMSQKKQKILLFVDNCTAHVVVDGLQAVRLEFLPPNSTCVLQPMDQGIIENLKKHYWQMLLNRIVLCMDSGKDYRVDLLGAIHLSNKAWSAVEPKTIANCFRHAGFSKDNDEAIPEESLVAALPAEVDRAGATLIARLQHDIPANQRVSFEEYVNGDNALECREELSDKEIVHNAMHGKAKHSDDEIEDQVERKKPRPAMKEALDAVDTLRRFFEETNSAFGNVLCEMENNVFDCASRKQTLITGYLSVKPNK